MNRVRVMALVVGMGCALGIGAGLLGGCDAGASHASEDADNEAAARATLERRGLTDIELERIDAQTFDFTATHEQEHCSGTVVVHPAREGMATAAMQLECE